MSSTIAPLSNASGYLPASTEAGSPLVSGTNPGLAQTAVSLAANSGVIATLGATSSTFQTYDAAGLLNTIAQSGVAPSTAIPVPASGTDTQSLEQQLLNQGIANSLPTNTSPSGIYTSSGTLTSMSSDTSTNWATILKADPSFSGTVISDSFAQGIVGSLSVLA